MKTTALLSILFLLAGCVRQVYVPVESTRTEYEYQSFRDSIYVHDSVYIHGKNDTLRIEKYKTVYRDRIVRDSVFRQDTIRVPYPVEKIVYKNKWNFLDKMNLLIISICALIGLMLVIRIWK